MEWTAGSGEQRVKGREWRAGSSGKGVESMELREGSGGNKGIDGWEFMEGS